MAQRMARSTAEIIPFLPTVTLSAISNRFAEQVRGLSCRQLPAIRLKQNGIPVKIEECPLPARKGTHVHRSGRIDPHPLQGRAMGHRRNDEPPAILEADKSTVKEVVDTGRQEQAVLAVQPLFVR